MFGTRKPQSPPTITGTTSATPVEKNLPAEKPPRQPVGFETVLGANSTFKGDLKSKANVRIDGVFEGALEIDGNMLIGETSRIIADIHAKNISIAGAVRGNITGQKIQLLRTGRVWGDISATAITTEEGAFIDGKITMLGHPAGEKGFTASLPAPEMTIEEVEEGSTSEPVEAELVEDPVKEKESKEG